jgi:hypothetical protein
MILACYLLLTSCLSRRYAGMQLYSSCAQVCVRISVVSKSSFVSKWNDIRMMTYEKARNK